MSLTNLQILSVVVDLKVLKEKRKTFFYVFRHEGTDSWAFKTDEFGCLA